MLRSTAHKVPSIIPRTSELKHLVDETNRGADGTRLHWACLAATSNSSPAKKALSVSTEHRRQFQNRVRDLHLDLHLDPVPWSSLEVPELPKRVAIVRTVNRIGPLHQSSCVKRRTEQGLDLATARDCCGRINSAYDEAQEGFTRHEEADCRGPPAARRSSPHRAAIVGRPIRL